MKNKICTIDNILRWSLLMVILSLVLACGGSGNGGLKKTKLGQLTVDKSLLPEQQLEMYKIQTDEFVQAIEEEGGDVLGRIYDGLFYVFYASSDPNSNFSIPPIYCKDIKTDKIKKILIPKAIDGHVIKINYILESFSQDGKILMTVTDKNPSELVYYNEGSVNVIYLNGNDLSFKYIVGGHRWLIREYNEEIYNYDNTIKLPFSQIFDGSYINNPAYLDLNNDQDSIKSNSQSDIPNEGIGEELRE